MLKLKPPTKKRRKELEKHPVWRKRISTEAGAHVDRGFQKKLKNTQKQNERMKRKKVEDDDKESEEAEEKDDDGFEIAGPGNDIIG